MIVALELQTRKQILTSEDAILSMYNRQKDEIESYKQKLDTLESTEQHLKRTIEGNFLVFLSVFKLYFRESRKNKPT